jgi:hypothetical protein
MVERIDSIEITNGAKRAVFVRDAEGWTPDWFYEGERRMLRFKDHEWLSIGHVHPTHAQEAEAREDGGVVFRGTSSYGRVEVAWHIEVRPDDLGGGFLVECAFTPAETVELLEAFTSFETPYEYDGSEHVTTVIGQNPVARWRGAERASPPVWRHPAWSYSREQAVHMTGPCNAPYVCQSVSNADGSDARHVTIAGDWNVCMAHDVYATPTRRGKRNVSGRSGTEQGEQRGYKYVVGALNWSSTFGKDPNVKFGGGGEHRQCVTVDFASKVPGGTLDAMLASAWERAAAFDLPADGRVVAFERAASRGVTWRAACDWIRGVFTGDGVDGFFCPKEGLATYAPGTRPRAGGYAWGWWPQWSGPLHYRALVLGDEELASRCGNLDALFARHVAEEGGGGNPVTGTVPTLAGLWWSAGAGRGGVLAGALRDWVKKLCESSKAENDGARSLDWGSQAATAEALLLGGIAYDERIFTEQALALVDEIDAQLDRHFWAFNMGRTGDLTHGGQIRALGHSHAAQVNMHAWQITRERRYLEAARRFVRFLIAISYATHDGSADPDFDWRGWCNGSNAGRDQIAEFPPFETSNSLLCVAALMNEAKLESGPYDAVWYFSRTGLAQFPTARTLKRVYDASVSHVDYVPRDSLASERDFYDPLPYLAYENPHDQTLLAPYQGADCLLGELVWGGGLAGAEDPRLGVFCPRAAVLDPRETSERVVHVWNPTREVVESTVTACWPGGGSSGASVRVEPRSAARLALRR